MDSPYPGEGAGPDRLLRLAQVYHGAALHLAQLGRPGDALSRAPYRLAAIHAVELYLNALLLHLGFEAAAVRGLQHDLARRTDLALANGLVLRRKTVAHLKALTGAREYLISRYDPVTRETLSPLNRLGATLEEVAAKASALIMRSTAATAGPADMRTQARPLPTAAAHG